MTADPTGLSEDGLRLAAGERSFDRGEDYIRYVRGLRVTPGRADASIQARRVYRVTLSWGPGDIDGECTCPWNAEGNFCKHLVAVGLAALETSPQGRRGADRTEGGQGPGRDPIETWLESLTSDELRSLVRDLAVLSEQGERLLTTRAAQATGDMSELAATFLSMTKHAMRARGHIDYRRSFEVASDAEDALDELERHLGLGTAEAAQAVWPALDYAVKRMRRIILHGDDSSGLMGGAGQHAADLHAQAARLARPDPSRLAKWLFAFRKDSPGWPDVTLDMYVKAFDTRALKAYRRAVETWAATFTDDKDFGLFEAHRMLLELADHDEDVDRAVEILAMGEHTRYGAIIERLRRVGRQREAMSWLDRAVDAGRVSGRVSNDYWLGVTDVVDAYLADGRDEDALAVLRSHLRASPTASSYRALLSYAAGLGCEDRERAWALTLAQETAEKVQRADLLITFALADGDVEAAWAAADRWGAGLMWRELAQAGADLRPKEAAELYRPGLAEALRHADTSRYPQIAATLVTMRDLYAKEGETAAFDAELSEIREAYRRRSSLIRELDRVGLRPAR